MPNTITPKTKGRRIKKLIGMDMNLESAEWVSWAANWTLIAALLFGVAATFAIVVSGNVKETALKLDLAKATESAAKANERAAGLEVKAAELQLEIVRLKAKRSLSEEQSAAFVEAMKPWVGMKVTFGTTQEWESISLAQQIGALLAQAGWQILPAQKGDLRIGGFSATTGFAVISGNGVIIGVHPASAIGKTMGGAANAMAALLTKDGIAASTGVDAALTIEDSINIDVGTKPK
jgi:hypothetical protein